MVIKGISWVTILFLLVSCGAGGQNNTPASTTTSPDSSTGLPAGAITTLNSLEKLDDYPFYVMQYIGDYEYPQISSNWIEATGFGCSLFTALGEGDKLFGRNFDWEFSPALLLFTNPPDGYASASMVDLTFLGISSAQARKLIETPINNRSTLLAAPSLPF